MNRALIIFAKNEVFGQVKTRLAATTCHETAMSVYQKLLQHTCAISFGLPVNKFVYYSDFIEHSDIWSGGNYQKRLQHGKNLGERMQKAFEEIFNDGAGESVIIGTDCPELSEKIILEAFIYLQQFDIVLGPAKDGGYYLLAMKALHRQLFENITWSTDMVLSQTLDICKQKLLSVHLLKELADIDNEQDWRNAEFTPVKHYHD